MTTIKLDIALRVEVAPLCAVIIATQDSRHHHRIATQKGIIQVTKFIFIHIASQLGISQDAVLKYEPASGVVTVEE